MKTITKDQAVSLIKASGTSFFNVEFTKKDGSLRSMNAVYHCNKELKGGINPVAHIEKYVTVRDVQKQAYRNINKETIKSLNINGEKYIVE